MTKPASILSALMATACITLNQPARAQAVDPKLGKVHFETSCSPDAAAAFDRGMLYQHSFWYRASQREFNKALTADPGCAIAYWGIALSLLWNPHVAPPVKNLADGAAALAKGKEVGARTERERDYITALSAMYTDYDKVDHHTRVLNYMKAMEQLAAKYPNDDEAQIDLRDLRSMSVLRRRIRPMPINSRAPRFWRRSGCGSRITRASRIT